VVGFNVLLWTALLVRDVLAGTIVVDDREWQRWATRPAEKR
jgi:hypothetical protein